MTVGIALMLYKITNLQPKPKDPSAVNMQFFALGVQIFFYRTAIIFFAIGQWGGDWLVKKEDSSFG